MGEIIFDTDVAKAFFEAEYNLVTLVWKKIVSSAEYRETFSRVADYIIGNKTPKFLADTRLQGIIHPNDRKWLEREIIPKAVKAGLKFTATVLDKNIFKKYYLSTLKDVSESSGMNFFRLFDNYDQGRQWILEQKG